MARLQGRDHDAGGRGMLGLSASCEGTDGVHGHERGEGEGRDGDDPQGQVLTPVPGPWRRTARTTPGANAPQSTESRPKPISAGESATPPGPESATMASMRL